MGVPAVVVVSLAMKRTAEAALAAPVLMDWMAVRVAVMWQMPTDNLEILAVTDL